jgi:hypothetical protein
VGKVRLVSPKWLATLFGNRLAAVFLSGGEAFWTAVRKRVLDRMNSNRQNISSSFFSFRRRWGAPPWGLSRLFIGGESLKTNATKRLLTYLLFLSNSLRKTKRR